MHSVAHAAKNGNLAVQPLPVGPFVTRPVDQVSTRLPTAFKMRTVTLRRHAGRSGFLVSESGQWSSLHVVSLLIVLSLLVLKLARDSQFKKVFELWVSQCTTVKVISCP